MNPTYIITELILLPLEAGAASLNMIFLDGVGHWLTCLIPHKWKSPILHRGWRNSVVHSALYRIEQRLAHNTHQTL